MKREITLVEITMPTIVWLVSIALLVAGCIFLVVTYYNKGKEEVQKLQAKDFRM